MNDPVTVSSLRIMRLGSKVGCSMPAPTMTRIPPRSNWLKPASMAAL